MKFTFHFKEPNLQNMNVHIYINSAYIRDGDYKENHGTKVRRKPVGFFVLLHNTLINKRIKRPK